MQGPQDRWDSPEDPRQNTVDLPRLTIAPGRYRTENTTAMTGNGASALPQRQPGGARAGSPADGSNPPRLGLASRDRAELAVRAAVLPPPGAAELASQPAPASPWPGPALAPLAAPVPGADAAPPVAGSRPAQQDGSLAPPAAASPAPADRGRLGRPGHGPAAPFRAGPGWYGAAERPARGSAADLRRRLELLPFGHPSSPYHDDGSRKPPIHALKHLELPLTGNDRDADSGRTSQCRSSANGTGPGSGQFAELLSRAAGSSAAGAARERGSSGPDSLPEVPAAAAGDFETQANGQATAPAGTVRRSPGPPPAPPPGPAGADEPRTSAQGSWEWRGARLAPQQSRIADHVYSQYQAAEGRNVFGGYGRSGLTPAMRRLESQLEHGRLAPDTERYALRDSNLFRFQLARLVSRHPDVQPQELAYLIPDVIRYAFVFAAGQYAAGTWEVHRRLKAQGFELAERRNGWAGAEYPGVRSRWLDPSHHLAFAVQFHTPESLTAQMRGAKGGLTAPPGCAEISDYRAEES